jgi:hypothetical protein
MKKEFINALVAHRNYLSLTQNLKAEQDGQVFTSPLKNKMFWKKRIERMGWREQRYCAANVVLTWVMYLMMAQNPLAYGIV